MRYRLAFGQLRFRYLNPCRYCKSVAKTAARPYSHRMTMDGLSIGVRARITMVDWAMLASDEAKRLQALGIDEGATVELAHRGVFAGRDPIALRIGSMTVALRRSHARAMTVEAL